MVSLPTEINKPSENISDYIWLFAGEKKVGKTAFIAQWPQTYILECEPGNASHLKCLYSDVHNWLEYTQYIELVKQNPKYCLTLAIDDVQSLYNFMLRYVEVNILKHKDEDKMKIDEWKIPRTKFYDAFQELRNLGKGLVLTNHIDIKTVMDIYGKEYSQLVPTFGNQTKDIVDGIAHFVGIMMRDNSGGRNLYIKGTSFVKCGHGFDSHFIDPNTGKELSYIEMGDSAEEAYANFVAAFYNSYKHKKPIVALEKTFDGSAIPKPLVTKPVPVVRQK